MKSTTKRAALGAVSAGIVAMSFTLASWAMPGVGQGHHFKPERAIERMAEKLDLTEEQRNEATEIVTEASTAARENREQLRALHEQLRAMRDTFDDEAAHALSDEIGEITADMVYRRSSSHAAIYALLTPEQREEFDEMQERRRDRGKGFRHHRRFEGE